MSNKDIDVMMAKRLISFNMWKIKSLGTNTVNQITQLT